MAFATVCVYGYACVSVGLSLWHNCGVDSLSPAQMGSGARTQVIRLVRRSPFPKEPSHYFLEWRFPLNKPPPITDFHSFTLCNTALEMQKLSFIFPMGSVTVTAMAEGPNLPCSAQHHQRLAQGQAQHEWSVWICWVKKMNSEKLQAGPSKGKPISASPPDKEHCPSFSSPPLLFFPYILFYSFFSISFLLFSCFHFFF